METMEVRVDVEMNGQPYAVVELPGASPVTRYYLARCEPDESLAKVRVTEMLLRIRRTNVGIRLYQGEPVRLGVLLECANCNGPLMDTGFSSADGLDLLLKLADPTARRLIGRLELAWTETFLPGGAGAAASSG